MPEKPGKFSIYSDEDLMFYIGNGEGLAFDELYTRYGRRLMGYFMRMLNFDKEEAEDALQDVFMKIAEAPEKFDRSRSFKTWVFCVASNYCKNYYRHRQVVAQCETELQYTVQKAEDDFFSGMSGRMDAPQFRLMLEEALNELPPEKKEAFILKYQEEKSIAEIAFIQGCPEGSVKSRLHYTIKLLEEKLKLFNPVM